MSRTAGIVLAGVYFLLCACLGGASVRGSFGGAILQPLAALLLILLFLRGRDRADILRQVPTFLAVAILGMLAIGLLQLVPLAPALWTRLPHRDQVVQGFELLGLPLPWLPISLDPEATRQSILGLLPPIAMFALMLIPNVRQWRGWSASIVALGLLTLILGVAQAVDGPSSRFSLYSNSSPGPVGFFADRNHQATLLLMALPFVAPAALLLFKEGELATERLSKAVLFAILFLMLVAGSVINGSFAALLVLPLVCLMILAGMPRVNGKPLTKVWLMLAALMAMAAAAALAPHEFFVRELASSLGEGSETGRQTIWSHSLSLASTYLPFGSGFGSFPRIYALSLAPEARGHVLVNHAHNDGIELLVETGVLGLIPVAAFLIWYVTAAIAAWRRPGATLERAASTAILVALVHSMVEFPLRTPAVAALFALSCALMIVPRRRNGLHDFARHESPDQER